MHCHDWATAPVAFGNPQAAPVFTSHNLDYGADLIVRAVAASAVATTVSPTYAAEARALGRSRVKAQGTQHGGLSHHMCLSADQPVDIQLVKLHRYRLRHQQLQ